jgi:chromosome segregation ATPase
MLFGVRDELLARIEATNARIDQTNARIDQLDARVAQLDARIEEVRSELRAEIQRVGVLVDEQEARNRLVLEVVSGHTARFERLEAGQAEIRALLGELVRALPRAPAE